WSATRSCWCGSSAGSTKYAAKTCASFTSGPSRGSRSSTGFPSSTRCARATATPTAWQTKPWTRECALPAEVNQLKNFLQKSVGLTGAVGQIFFHRDFEIHKLVRVGVAHSGDIKMGAGQRMLQVTHVKKEEAGLRGFGLHCTGLKHRVLNFVETFARDGALRSSPRQRDRERRARVRFAGAALEPGEAAAQIVRVSRKQFVLARGDQLHLHVRERNRLVAVVGDDQVHRQQPTLFVGQREDRGLVRHVVRIGGN